MPANRSRRLGGWALLLLLSAVLAPAVRADDIRLLPPRAHARAPEAFVAGEVLVKFRRGVAGAKAEPLAGALGLVREARLEGIGVERYRIAGGGDVLETVRRLRQRPDVLFAEPNYLAWPAVVPNDTFYSNVGGFARDLQRWTFGGTAANAGIGAEAAWNVTTGRPDVTIAVVDSGVALAHPDVAPNVWTNPGEVANNGADDDGNGYVDDVNGWDFYAGDPDPNPDLGNGRNDDGVGFGDDNTFHGTFVANTAAGRGNDGAGVLGAAWNCRVMALKVFTDDGGANNFHIAAAFEYAADNGADVINASLTTGSNNATLANAVAYAVARDCVVVAAAGNFNEPSVLYPAAFPGVVSVGASGHAFESPDQANFFGPAKFDGRADFSQYGQAAVDVVAPGIVFGSSVASATDAAGDPSLEPGDFIAFAAGGTSFASPLVAGLAALLVSRDKDLNGGLRTLSSAEIAGIIESTTVDLADDPTDSPDAGANWDGKGRVSFPAALARVSGGTGGRAVRLGWQPPSGEPLAPPRNLTADESGAKQGGAVAESEPNNRPEAAQVIELPVTVSGQISTSDEGPVRIEYSNAAGDVVEDFYELTLLEETSVTITLTPDGDADLDLALMTDLDGDGEYTFEAQYLRNEEATRPRQPEVFDSVDLPAGTYYVACTIYDGAPRVESDGYTLSVTAGAADVTAYRVYRATSPNVATTPANRVAELSGAQLSFVDSTAPEGDLYYVVTAVYDAGESAASNEASPGAENPNAPVIIGPAFKKGKLTLAAAGSKIVAGSTLVVGGTETFTLAASKDGAKWMVKKKTRSAPGGRRIAQLLPKGQEVTLVVVAPGGLRSAPVTFRR